MKARYEGITYVGDITEPRGGYGWHAPADGKTQFCVGTNPGERLEGRLAHDKGKYLGRFDGTGFRLRFVAAKKAPEEEIEM